MPFLFVVAVIVIAIGAIFNALAQQKRREGLLELAQRLNLILMRAGIATSPAVLAFSNNSRKAETAMPRT